MKYTYKVLKKGEWNKYKKGILFIEQNCFKKDEKTYVSVFKEFVDKNPNAFCIIIKHKKRTIAYMLCCKLEDSEVNDRQKGKNNTIYLFSIAVLKKYRNKGLGRQMMVLLDVYVSLFNYKRITFHSKRDNFKHLCYKLGYRKIKDCVMEKSKTQYWGKWL